MIKLNVTIEEINGVLTLDRQPQDATANPTLAERAAAEIICTALEAAFKSAMRVISNGDTTTMDLPHSCYNIGDDTIQKLRDKKP